MRFLAIAIVQAIILVGTDAQAQVGRNQALVDPNLADAETLLSLPHVTEDLAASIIDERPFVSAQQLNDLLSQSLNDSQLGDLYGHMFRQIDLNAASEAEIMLIPRMTRRMVHEFAEYKPYASLEQFRREIGKYVDDEEVARLEQYVFIPMNLNTATADDFMTIPGITRRMAHEFEEYKPYASIEQFRREIGKYVDEAEVARLESYITLE